MRAQTIAGVIAVAALVLGCLFVVQAQQTPSSAPAHRSAVTAPTPTPAPDAWADPRWDSANLTTISLIAFVGVLPWLIVLGVVVRGHHRSRLLEPDHPPLRDREAVQATYAWRTAQASTWPLQSLSYSHRVQGVEAPPPLVPVGPVHMPTLEEMLRAPGIIYGIDVTTGKPVMDGRTISLAIGGMQGSGKTTTAALLVAQHAARQAQILVGDLDADHEQGLVRRLEGVIGPVPGDQVAAEPKGMLALAERTFGELQERQRTWSLRGDGEKRPVLLVLDEFPQLVRRLSDRERGRLLDILQIIGGYSGRKYLMAVLLMAQSWASEAVQSTQVRNLVAAVIAHRMRSEEARVLTGISRDGLPVDPILLDPGEALLTGLGAEVARVRMPALSLPAAVPMPSAVLREPSQGAPEVARSTPGALADGNRTAQILELAGRGADIREIVARVYGIEKTGRSYTAAAREVWSIVTGQIGATDG